MIKKLFVILATYFFCTSTNSWSMIEIDITEGNREPLPLAITEFFYDDDEKKYEEFLMSNNWHFFVNACANYGFMVDRHIPYRLVADIASGPMLSYAQVYGAASTDEVLIAGYSTAHRQYFSQFKQIMFDFYDIKKIISCS
mgnify:CR=1 FL=1